MKKPLALIILDGFGYNPQDYGNAIAAAKKPNIDRLMATCPHTLIGASGLDVGLPDGQMGNSEVGHTNIGAGRIVYQELTRISKSIEDGDFFQNPALLAAVENCKKNDSALHLMGLCSDGGVHSHNFTVCCGWRRTRGSRRCTSTASWTAATCPRPLAWISLRRWKPR